MSSSLVVLTAVAAWTDLRERRIPNWLTAAGLVVGVSLQTALGGWGGLWSSALGAGLALLIYLPLYALRAIGGGDVKLMAAVGALAGAPQWLPIFVLASIFGGIWALLLLLARRSLGQAVVNALHVIADTGRLRAPWRSRPELDVHHPKAVSVPHAAAIALGTFVFLLFG